MADRLARDGLALLLWSLAFVGVGTCLGLALVLGLSEAIVRSSLLGSAVNVLVAATAGTAGTLLGRRYPAPDGIQPEPRDVLLTGPVLLVVLSVVTGPAWDVALGGAVAVVVTATMLVADRATR